MAGRTALPAHLGAQYPVIRYAFFLETPDSAFYVKKGGQSWPVVLPSRRVADPLSWSRNNGRGRNPWLYPNKNICFSFSIS